MFNFIKAVKMRGFKTEELLNALALLDNGKSYDEKVREAKFIIAKELIRRGIVFWDGIIAE